MPEASFAGAGPHHWVARLQRNQQSDLPIPALRELTRRAISAAVAIRASLRRREELVTRGLYVHALEIDAGKNAATAKGLQIGADVSAAVVLDNDLAEPGTVAGDAAQLRNQRMTTQFGQSGHGQTDALPAVLRERSSGSVIIVLTRSIGTQCVYG